jgi:glycerol-3-phosphate cytidylyltransferase
MRNEIGYTQGVFDLFHVGHLNLLRLAKREVEYLIVGVSTDELATSYKGAPPVIPLEERMEIIRSLRVVDKVVPQVTLDKVAQREELGFTKIFVGDDWKGSDRWNEYEKKLSTLGVEVIFIPYTASTSSTQIKLKIQHM